MNKRPINSNIKENDHNLNLQRSKVPLNKSKSKTNAMSYEAVPLNFVTAEPFELTTIVADRFHCSRAIIGVNIGQSIELRTSGRMTKSSAILSRYQEIFAINASANDCAHT